jgi:hypothetical protein
LHPRTEVSLTRSRQRLILHRRVLIRRIQPSKRKSLIPPPRIACSSRPKSCDGRARKNRLLKRKTPNREWTNGRAVHAPSSIRSLLASAKHAEPKSLLLGVARIARSAPSQSSVAEAFCPGFLLDDLTSANAVTSRAANATARRYRTSAVDWSLIQEDGKIYKICRRSRYRCNQSQRNSLKLLDACKSRPCEVPRYSVSSTVLQ